MCTPNSPAMCAISYGVARPDSAKRAAPGREPERPGVVSNLKSFHFFRVVETGSHQLRETCYERRKR